jgi:hypothetical protein
MFVVASSERGQPGRVVASIVNGVPFWGVTWKTDLKPISSASELRNLNVAAFPAPSTAYVLQEKMFKDAGLSVNISQGGCCDLAQAKLINAELTFQVIRRTIATLSQKKGTLKEYPKPKACCGTQD